MPEKFDAIVVGSGISGGWAAKELCEKGLKVLLLERGGPYEHVKDYKTAANNPWDFPHRGNITEEQKKERPVISRSFGAQEPIMDAWANEQDCPYVEDQPFSWWRSYRMGGRSILWGRQSYRWSEMDFDANKKDGIAVDWPIRYKDIAPWYDHVESFAGISGSLEGLSQLPDGKFLPPMELNCVEKDAAARMKQHYKGMRHLIIGRSANITKPLPGRAACQYRNRCWEGCPFGGYFSTQSSTMPAALATGSLTVRPWSIVFQVDYDKESGKAKGVTLMDAMESKTYSYEANIVFLCASTINSAWILMQSATGIWPGGLGSSSGQLGRNIMDHHYHNGAEGRVEGYLDKYYFGRRANGFYIPRFANIGSDKRDFLRGYGYQGSASRQDWRRDIAELGIGADLKNALSLPGEWRIGMTGFGEVLPDERNRMYLHQEKRDKWGLPVPVMDASLQENEAKMRVGMMEDAIEMLEALGAKDVHGWNDYHPMGDGIHEMGTARMGRDPKTSVLNGNNQVWDCKNVFVTDGSCMTSSACQNPSLTYMALTARAANFAVNELKKGNL